MTLLASQETRLAFFADKDGTLVAKPSAKGFVLSLAKSSHRSKRSRASHQQRTNPTDILESITALRNSRRNSKDLFALITASAMDRFINKPAKITLFAKHKGLDVPSGAINPYDNPDDQDEVFGQHVFDIVSAAFGKVEIKYVNHPDGSFTAEVTFGDEVDGASELAKAGEVFLQHAAPLDMVQRITLAWRDSKDRAGFFGTDSAIHQELNTLDSPTTEDVRTLVANYMEISPFGMCFHGISQETEAQLLVGELFEALADKVSSEGIESTVGFEGLSFINIRPSNGFKQFRDKVDAFEHLVDKHLEAHDGPQVFFYAGDSPDDVVLMRHLQEKYQSDDVRIFCVGVGDVALFDEAADIVVPGIDELNSVIAMMAKAGVPHGHESPVELHDPLLSEDMSESSILRVARERAIRLVKGPHKSSIPGSRVAIDITSCGKAKAEKLKTKSAPVPYVSTAPTHFSEKVPAHRFSV